MKFLLIVSTKGFYILQISSEIGNQTVGKAQNLLDDWDVFLAETDKENFIVMEADALNHLKLWWYPQ